MRFPPETVKTFLVSSITPTTNFQTISQILSLRQESQNKSQIKTFMEGKHKRKKKEQNKPFENADIFQ